MTHASNPVHEMLTDTGLLSAAALGEPTIRVYRWTTICVTLGQNQDPKRAMLEPDSVSWAYRPTGGGAVLHGHDITLSAAVPKVWIAKSSRTVYDFMAQFAIDYLTVHGIEARLSGDPDERSTTEYCFGRSAPCDVVDVKTGQKICGCALRAIGRAVLLQTSMPYKTPDVDPAEIIRGAKWIGTPEWRPDEDFDPQTLPSWQALLRQASA